MQNATRPSKAESTEPALSLLLIDDDRELCSMMQQFFAECGHKLHYEHDGQRGLIAATSGIYDLVILDVMLPTLDGFTVLEHIRRRNNLPVVMLTARMMHRDRIQGLNTGADDYLPKPFEPDELLARIRAILRRTIPAASGDAIQQIGDLQINLTQREVRVADVPLPLTEMEFTLLEILMRSNGRIVTREELAIALFEREAAPHDRILDVHVSNLRKKLGAGRNLVRTVRGVGYVFAHSA